MKKFLLSLLMTICAIAINAQSYVKVTESQTDWSGKYLIVYESSATEGYIYTGVDATQNYVSATINDGVITDTSLAQYLVEIAPIEGSTKYSLMISNDNPGTNAGKYMYQSANSNGLNFNSKAQENTITMDEGAISITCASGPKLQFYKGGANSRFRYYKTTQQGIAIYKYTEGEGGGEEPGGDPVEPEIPTKGDTYRLVTSNSELEANEKYIIVAAESDYAMSTTQNSNNRGKNLITKNGNLITLSDESIANVQVLTLEQGTIDDTWAFNTGAGYLYAAGGTTSNNYLRTKNNKDEVASAIIAVSTEGIASIVFQGEVSRNTLKYNSSSSLFSCYASGQTDVSLYKYIKTVATPVISKDGDDMISITCATEGATIYYTIDGTTPTTSSTQYTGAFKLTVDSLTVKAIAVKDGWKNSTVASEALVPTAIEEVGVDAGEAVYYNLQGVKVANPENGIFIKKQGGRTSKVVL